MKYILSEPKSEAGPRQNPRAWLDHFPPERRSTIANWFHHGVRNGARTPQAVCSAVWQTVQQRLHWSSDLANRQFLQGALDTLRATQQEALAYAQSVLEYERLPYEARQQVKAQRTLAALKLGMRGKPTTEAQYGLCTPAGDGELPADRAEASALIDQLQTQQGGDR